MYTVSKIFRVSTGHRLSKHKGLCKNFHGHNLRIEVQVSCLTLNDNDMVIDFSKLKEMVNKVLEDWDHCLFLNSNDLDFIQVANDCNLKLYVLHEVDPTAEVLSRLMYDSIEHKIRDMDLILDHVKIWENDDSFALYRWYRED